MALQRLDAVAFTHRSALLVGAAAPLAWAALSGLQPPLPELVAGGVLATAGAALRLASIRWLGKRARVSRAKATELVGRGPYARVRNPLYVAAVLIVAGLGLMAGLGAWALLPAAWAFLVYDRAVRHEERALIAAHGEAATTYMQLVPRWLPRLTACDGPPIEREAWAQVVRREWRLVVFMPLALGALVVLAASDLGAPLRTFAASLAGFFGAPLHVFIGVVALVAAIGNAVKTVHDLDRKARRRAQAEEQAAVDLAAPVPDQATS